MTIIQSPVAPVSESSSPPPSRSRRWLKRGVWVVLLAIAGGLLGLAIGARLDRQVSAEVSLLLVPLPGNAFSDHAGNTLIDLETESHLPQSDAVLRRVAAGEGTVPNAELIRRRLTVRIVPNSSVIILRYRAGTAEQAKQIATLVAEATLEERQARAAVAGAARLEILAGQQEALDEQKAALGGEAADGAEGPVALSPEMLKVFSQRAANLLAQENAASDTSASPGQIISTTVRPDGLREKLRVGVLVAGVGLGALVGLWVSRTPRRQR
jgi:hypothetical protein